MLLLILFALEVVTAAFLTWRARSAYADFIQEHRDKLDLPFLAPLSLWLMDRMRLADRFPEAVSRVHQVMVGLYGSKTALVRTRCFLIRMISLSVAVMTGCTLIGWLADGNAELLGYGLCLTAFLPFVLYKEQAGKLLKKKRQMLLELPEMLNQIVLLVNAGRRYRRRCSAASTRRRM
ncbi:hypothetical protein SK3146_00781 [Paenibacillus konkukensis]|uniref:Uncharacterized protein n=1 Tax=Paenibacillus konkukensis TaxID=2020716 RepID=A0ABY4RIJ8_9BACL|nr:hypothetical protein [Paenibacillus konkukensis]UQZ81625.1 hypothetical protein SK3146_00781 [Paenibacillus konkukensis]